MRVLSSRSFVAAVLLFAALLRLIIVVRGGEGYWSDEQRYHQTRKLYAQWAESGDSSTWRSLLAKSDHVGFRWLALVPAAIEHRVYGPSPPHGKIAAAFFAVFGVANLYLVWKIARARTRHPWEAALALVFAASSNALFFHARHCFPYDASLTFFLVAAYASVSPPRQAQPFLVGLSSGLGYLTYNGYWSIGAVILLVEVAWQNERWLARIRRAALAAAGLVAPIAFVVLLARAAGYDLISDAQRFAGTVNQGDFGDGWRFVPEYLWVSDGLFVVGLFGLMMAGVIASVRRRETPHWLRWVVVVVLFIAIWVLFADVVRKFVLYGRTVRALVPFLALAAAGATATLHARASARARSQLVGAAAGLCVAGLGKMIAPLRQVFPPEFRQMAETLMTGIREHEPDAVFQLLFAGYLIGPDFPEPPPPHRELLRRSHPHHYRPYLYEGYTRAQRPLYLQHDVSMRLIQLETRRGLHVFQRTRESRWLAPHPGPLTFFLSFPVNKTGETETLLTHGDAPDRQHAILVQYVSASQLRLGCKVAGQQTVLSPPVNFESASNHVVTVSLGSFYAAKDDPRFASVPEVRALAQHYRVDFDDETILSGEAAFAPLTIEDLRLGQAAEVPAEHASRFSGRLTSVRQIDARHLARGTARPDVPPVRGPHFGSFPGSIEMAVRFPRNVAGAAEPLLAVGQTGAGDLLYVTYLDDRHVRFGFDHWGAPSLQSPAVEVEPDKPVRLVVSFGSLFPPPGDPAYEAKPDQRFLERWLYVRCDDRVVFSQSAEFHRGPPETLAFARSIPGGTAARDRFTGDVLELHRRPPELLGLTDGAIRGPRAAGR